MNELDSELVQDQLVALGFEFMDNRDEADVVLFNTCSVREQAENKVLSRVGQLGIEKKKGSNWGLDWDFGAYLTYDVAEQVMKDFEKYNMHPEDYRLVMYISEKPYDV